MSKHLSATKSATSIPAGLAIGFGASWAVTLAVTVFLTFLVLGGGASETILAPAAVAVVLLASYIGGIVGAKKIGHHRLQVCLACGGMYYVSLVCCNALFFGGSHHGMVPALLTMLGSCLLAGLTGTRQKKGKFKASKWRYKI